MQFGAYLVGQGFPAGQNLTGATPAAGYTLFDFTDLTFHDLLPVMGSCFSTSQALTLNQSLVDDCAAANNGGCCYDFGQNPLPVVRFTQSHVLCMCM